MMMRTGDCLMTRLSSSPKSASFTVLLVVVTLGVSSGVTSPVAAQSQARSVERSTLPNLRLFSNSQRELASSMLTPLPSSAGKTRKVREIARGQSDHGGDEDLQQDYRGPEVLSASPKLKSMYSPLSGSGELLRLFKPLTWSPDKTIGISRWYLPGVGYFSRGGRAASSNFIRFGRNDPSAKFLEDDDATNGGGDVTMLSRNGAKKKNNFIRLGRENPRQTNFIRLGRSGPLAQPGEFYNSGYITPALSDPLRDDEDGRHDFN